MVAFDPSFDYPALLKLTPTAARAAGPARLGQLVAEEKRACTRNEQNPKYQQDARRTKERLLAFEGLLADPDALEAYLAFLSEQEATRRAADEAAVAKLVTVALAGRSSLTAGQRSLLEAEVRTARIHDDVLDAVLRQLRVTVAPAAAAPEAPRIPHHPDALDPAVMAELQNWLSVLGRPTLYALLELPDTTDPKTLAAAGRLLYARWSKALPKTSECTAWEKTSLACVTYFRDATGKQRYDGSLLNQRIDQFLKRVDLILAGGRLGREEQESLTLHGVKEFGLSADVVRQCITARAAGQPAAVGEPVVVYVSVDRHWPCRFCYTWNPAENASACRACGLPAGETCANPVCRTKTAKPGARCPACRLPFAKGKLYAAAVALAESCLDSGLCAEGLRAAEVAVQFHSSPHGSALVTRAQTTRTLLALVLEAARLKRWSRVLRELPRLLELAPRIRHPRLPRLEAVVDLVKAAQAKLESVGETADALERAKVSLSCLTHWSDSAAARSRLRLAAEALVRDGRVSLACGLAEKILQRHADDAELRAFATDLARRACAAAGDPVVATPRGSDPHPAPDDVVTTSA